MRKLVTIREIGKIEEIKGADKIELAFIDGWQCVVQKGEFTHGGLCLFFEIDSILPNVPVFDFMQPRKWRVRTIKCMKHISQGLAKPLSILTEFGLDPVKYDKESMIGTDLTDLLKVKKYDPEAAREEAERVRTPGKPAPWYIQMARRLPVIGKYFMRRKGGGNFPTHIIPQTDEERYQNLSHRMKEGFIKYKFDVTEKLDGTSTTFIYRPESWWKRFLFGDSFMVCSRTLTKVHEDDSWWWNSARNCKAREEMVKLHKTLELKSNQYLVFQGETTGPKIQKNKYKRNTYDFFLFNVKIVTPTPCGKVKTISWSPDEIRLAKINYGMGIQHVPVLKLAMEVSSVEELDKLLKDRPWGIKSTLNPDQIAEGIVVRLENQNTNDLRSFKYINPEFSLKEDASDDTEE
jgi:hypothetical protein